LLSVGLVDDVEIAHFLHTHNDVVDAGGLHTRSDSINIVQSFISNSCGTAIAALFHVPSIPDKTHEKSAVLPCVALSKHCKCSQEL
jgi:hypothetical protein